MAEQLTLFDQPPTIAPRDTHVEKEERPRLSGQNLAILERLQRGPATNRELAAISLKYTSRVSDLRAAGYNVALVARDRATGVTMYELITTKEPNQ
ncbi:MAG: hypothetical protein ACYC4U_11195 [Pirellulaceae bacterium]